MSSLRWSQAVSFDLSLAAACLNRESYLRQAATVYAAKRWHIMAWYFTSWRASRGWDWTRTARNIFQASSHEARLCTCLLVGRCFLLPVLCLSRSPNIRSSCTGSNLSNLINLDATDQMLGRSSSTRNEGRDCQRAKIAAAAGPSARARVLAVSLAMTTGREWLQCLLEEDRDEELSLGLHEHEWRRFFICRRVVLPDCFCTK